MKVRKQMLRFWHFHQHSSLLFFIEVASATQPTKFFWTQDIPLLHAVTYMQIFNDTTSYQAHLNS